MVFYAFYFKTIISITTAVCFIVVVYKFVDLYFPRSKKKNKILLLESVSDWNDTEEEILSIFENASFIGIDCEWVTEGKKRKPVALLQLATDDGFCVLLRLCRIPVWFIPHELSELLRNRDIIKVGVGVFEDARKLFKDCCLSVHGLLDIRHLAKDLPEFQGMNGLGLKTLAKEILNKDLEKSVALRCSDWEADTLSNEQIQYAADDAITSVRVFSKLRKQKWNLKSLILGPKLNEDLYVYIDIPFKQTTSGRTVEHTNVSHNKQGNFKTRYSKPRQKPMYDNCKLEAPDGELLCSCDKKKAEWYAYKGLGEITSEDPFTVRLNFEPSGRPKLDDIYYTKTKLNCCVVCGVEKDFHRKLVVPSEYRKYFPELMKKYLSHDVLLLCVDCHKRSNILDRSLREKLAVECDAPISRGKRNKYIIDPVLSKVKSAASALLAAYDKLPKERKELLEKVIKDYYKIEDITKKVLVEASNVEAAKPNKDFVCHGLKVFQHACANGGLINFETRWRQHFLDTMKPKFLPVMWSIEHNHERLVLQVENRDIDFDVSILGLNQETLKRINNTSFRAE